MPKEQNRRQQQTITNQHAGQLAALGWGVPARLGNHRIHRRNQLCSQRIQLCGG